MKKKFSLEILASDGKMILFTVFFSHSMGHAKRKANTYDPNNRYKKEIKEIL
jgi:hypothetical protein